ncbi:hypothetical protein [Pseudomonas paralcaligenes]|uniref:hypothetical protein n=1 Tax=Pseudomonas paralcaligenes TaxID=2772558 RepID=UPI001C81145C|nr:hypothetical protein [Pseudomonas paralcaligenes]
MRKLLVVAGLVLITGCSTTANIHKLKGAAAAKPAHNRDVCLLNTSLPDGIEVEYMGRGVSNSQWYGGYSKVKAVLADRARQGGVDVVSDLQYRQVIGFFAWVRPRIYGDAYALKHPESFNCLALGGQPYSPLGIRPIPPAPSSAVATSAPAQTYDECMARVLRIQDENLRLQSMALCDSADR